MFRFQTTLDFQVGDEDVLVEQLTRFRDQTGGDMLPALAATVQRVGGESGTLYLTVDFEGTWYWTTDEPAEWPAGLIVARWNLVELHEGEVEIL